MKPNNYNVMITTQHPWFKEIKEAIEHEAHSFHSIKADGRVLKAFDDLDDKVIEKLNDTTLYPELEWDATVRNNNDLSEGEIKFIHDRKLFIREAFAKYVGVDISEIHVDDIPVIAIIGSESGLYDCGVYLAGLSGSCWTLGQLYTSIAQSHENPIQALVEFHRTKLSHSIFNPHGLVEGFAETSDPQTAVELVFGSLIRKKATGIKLSIIDVYSTLLAAKILIDKDPTKQLQFGDFKLSEQRKYIDGGKNLMPLYVSTYHNRPWEDTLNAEEAALFPNYEEMYEIHKMKKDYYQWYEFNPYEIGCDETPAWIPSWAFGRKFELGKNVERFPEQSLGLLLGIMGAAPSASLQSEIRALEEVLPEGKFKDELRNLYDEAMEIIGTQKQKVIEGYHPIPQPYNYNFSYHLNPTPPYKLGPANNEMTYFGDAGVSNDFPMYPVTHPNRKVDIVIGFDCSAAAINTEVFEKKQEIFCKRRGYNKITRDVTNEYCEVYDFIPTGKTSDEFLTPAQKQFVLCYIPFRKNDKVDPNFIPSKTLFSTLFNFSYTTDQVDLMNNLAKANWLESENQVKGIIIDTWKKKRHARLNGINFP
ncbi:8629_t:CDS:2 [Diversispora eburnea]|uniref:Lysophospholipase n=1 Tax=Diversispora eburnea TaxID=1213867 RepID=A0A9N9AJ09_9GLOM|nr:8629_t:CDS:2 [Diversispora eburnea]